MNSKDLILISQKSDAEHFISQLDIDQDGKVRNTQLIKRRKDKIRNLYFFRFPIQSSSWFGDTEHSEVSSYLCETLEKIVPVVQSKRSFNHTRWITSSCFLKSLFVSSTVQSTFSEPQFCVGSDFHFVL